MGLDIICDDYCERVGSYSCVHVLRKYLLESLIKHLENNNKIENLSKEIMLEYLNKLVSSNDIIYNQFNEDMHDMLNVYNLGGFDSFIFHSDCDGTLESEDATKFLETYRLIENDIDKSKFHNNDTFYLYDIFHHSSTSGEGIVFC